MRFASEKYISDKKSGDYVYALLFAFLGLPDNINEKGREREREREGKIKLSKLCLRIRLAVTFFISAWLPVA